MRKSLERLIRTAGFINFLKNLPIIGGLLSLASLYGRRLPNNRYLDEQLFPVQHEQCEGPAADPPQSV